MTPDELSREVRARMEWGHPTEQIRSELLCGGADPATLDELLRRHLRAIHAQYRWKGLWGLFAAAALFLGAYLVGSLVHSGALQPPPGHYGRGVQGPLGALFLGLLVAGAASFAIGAHRLIAGRRGDT